MKASTSQYVAGLMLLITSALSFLNVDYAKMEEYWGDLLIGIMWSIIAIYYFNLASKFRKKELVEN